MTRQTLLGVFFLLMGAAVMGAALVAKPIAITILLIGVGLTVFGAFLLPSSGASVALTQIFVLLGNTNLPLVGGRRSGDPK